MIAVVDYGMGNVRSVMSALEYIGGAAVLTADPDEIARADRLVLPGVGAFGDAMGKLTERGLVEVLAHEVLRAKKPFLGICLGMQLMATSSTEHGTHEGLGWIDATVVRFGRRAQRKVPHMGWNDLDTETPHPLFHGLKPAELAFFFVHSFHVACRFPRDVIATCEYEDRFAAVIGAENMIGVQFHPEKSQDSGLQVLRNFINWIP